MTRSSFAFVTAAPDHVNRRPGHRRAEELKTKDKTKTEPPPTTKEADPKIKVTERARIEVRPLRVESIRMVATTCS